jgi:hypothetical protein
MDKEHWEQELAELSALVAMQTNKNVDTSRNS